MWPPLRSRLPLEKVASLSVLEQPLRPAASVAARGRPAWLRLNKRQQAASLGTRRPQERADVGAAVGTGGEKSAPLPRLRRELRRPRPSSK